jgi:hypothetical protein
MDAESKKSCCKALQKKVEVVDPYTCCEYPNLVVWKWQSELCMPDCGLTNETINNEYVNGRCCYNTCCFKYLKVIGNKPHLEGIDIEGLKFSFLLSVSLN